MESVCGTLNTGLWALGAGLWTLEARLLGSGRSNFKILNCPKCCKQWRYINKFILEFSIEVKLWSFQVWKILLNDTFKFYVPRFLEKLA